MPGHEHRDGDAAMLEIRRQIRQRVRRWSDLPRWALWLTPEMLQVVPRSELVGRLQSADLRNEARAASRMNVPPGHILLWIESESSAGLSTWRVQAAIPDPGHDLGSALAHSATTEASNDQDATCVTTDALADVRHEMATNVAPRGGN